MSCGAAGSRRRQAAGSLRVLPLFHLRRPQLWRSARRTGQRQRTNSCVNPAPKKPTWTSDSSLPRYCVCAVGVQLQAQKAWPSQTAPLLHTSFHVVRPGIASPSTTAFWQLPSPPRPVPQAASIIVPGPVPQQERRKNCQLPVPQPSTSPLFHSSRRMTDGYTPQAVSNVAREEEEKKRRGRSKRLQHQPPPSHHGTTTIIPSFPTGTEDGVVLCLPHHTHTHMPFAPPRLQHPPTLVPRHDAPP